MALAIAFLAGCLIAALTACGGGNPEPETPDVPTPRVDCGKASEACR